MSPGTRLSADREHDKNPRNVGYGEGEGELEAGSVPKIFSVCVTSAATGANWQGNEVTARRAS